MPRHQNDLFVADTVDAIDVVLARIRNMTPDQRRLFVNLARPDDATSVNATTWDIWLRFRQFARQRNRR